jgi:hypothetical protein
MHKRLLFALIQDNIKHMELRGHKSLLSHFILSYIHLELVFKLPVESDYISSDNVTPGYKWPDETFRHARY